MHNNTHVEICRAAGSHVSEHSPEVTLRASLSPQLHRALQLWLESTQSLAVDSSALLVGWTHDPAYGRTVRPTLAKPEDAVVLFTYPLGVRYYNELQRADSAHLAAWIQQHPHEDIPQLLKKTEVMVLQAILTCGVTEKETHE